MSCDGLIATFPAPCRPCMGLHFPHGLIMPRIDLAIVANYGQAQYTPYPYVAACAHALGAFFVPSRHHGQALSALVCLQFPLIQFSMCRLLCSVPFFMFSVHGRWPYTQMGGQVGKGASPAWSGYRLGSSHCFPCGDCMITFPRRHVNTWFSRKFIFLNFYAVILYGYAMVLVLIEWLTGFCGKICPKKDFLFIFKKIKKDFPSIIGKKSGFSADIC